MVRIKRQKVRVKKKITLPKKLFSNVKAIVKFLIAILILSGIGIGLVRLKYMFVDSEYFMVKGIDTELYDDAGTFRNLPISDIADESIVGTNIFFIDLDALKKNVELNHPEFKDVVIRRLLPDKLVVQAILRKSFAQLRSDRYYTVDAEGILLPDIKNFPDSKLPIIAGFGRNLAKASTSKLSKFERENLNKALNLIKELSEKKELSGYKLKVVDITDPNNISFFFDGVNVEIKIGNSDFRDRLSILVTVLDQVDDDIDRFKYIDLRFEDPIIGSR